MLEWDEAEFIGILEVTPEVIEDEGGGPFYVFNVSNNGVVLELTVFPFEEDIRFRLFRSGEHHPLLEYQIQGCKFARHHIDTSKNSYLSFVSKTGVEVTVTAKPDIQVLFALT
ncbi:hypothetical protein [Pseudoalteromonas rubra]|uniref:Uncharacterized protein n=1 Tax=Pseudoalteromonas rubra TaxID=43658 RepID=A0A0F4Q8M4_9GAMM|nr:hypothetical protein [Pseudoalteromonas rubra]KJZ03679.1 hypothetical protein TW77_23860 [Pseudoalteromonas rubra]